jgi:hypothetical protein
VRVEVVCDAPFKYNVSEPKELTFVAKIYQVDNVIADDV